jgi:hypothetical protein
MIVDAVKVPVVEFSLAASASSDPRPR